MGEQSPMDTIKELCTRGLGDRPGSFAKRSMPDPAEVWSKPDLRTGSLELRRITTRPSSAFRQCSRPAFEPIFMNCIGPTCRVAPTLGDVRKTGFSVFCSAIRLPGCRRLLRSLWVLLLFLSLAIVYLAAASLFKPDVSIFGIQPYGWMAPFSSWLGPLLAAAIGIFRQQPSGALLWRVVRATPARHAGKYCCP